MASIPEYPIAPPAFQPAWDVALLFPGQGDWSENEYLGLETNRLVELIDGNLEVPPMPTFMHQRIVWYLAAILREFVLGRQLGEVFIAPLSIRIRERTFREPDIILSAEEVKLRPHDNYLRAANLVIEVVSSDDKSQKRDYLEKRRDYADVGIPEYWIVDPQVSRITVLALDGRRYRVHGEFAPGEFATSVLMPGLSVDVTATFAAGTKAS